MHHLPQFQYGQAFNHIQLSLLNEKGIQGARVVGATGINTRTGEFMIFKARAVVFSTAGIGSIWVFNTELAGISTFRSRNASGDGTVMAFHARLQTESCDGQNDAAILIHHRIAPVPNIASDEVTLVKTQRS